MGEPHPRQRDDRSDEELLSAAANGNDPKAFEAVCVQILPPLRAFIRGRCSRFQIQLEMADDFVHDTLVKAIEFLRNNPGSKVHSGWLRRVAGNAVADWRRRQRLTQATFDDTLEPTGGRLQNPYGPLADSVDEQEVMVAFSKLSPADQQILSMILLEALDTKVAAQRLSISVWAAYKRYNRALLRLRGSVSQ